jgi:ribokinase
VAEPAVCVVGASNLDLVSYVPRLPRLGETLHGSRFDTGYGGKAANQAVMAAKLGSRVSLVARVGRDPFGQRMLDNFRQVGVDVAHVAVTDAAPSGVATILVDTEGHNCIVIVGGANQLLSTEDVLAARPAIAAAGAVVCQLEVQLETSMAALREGKRAGAITILNPAPAPQELPEEAYRLTDVLCPNQVEAERLSGVELDGAGAESAVVRLLERGAGSVIVTLGEHGCLVARGQQVTRIPGERVPAVDSTGAGDAFVGSLAHFLAAGCPLEEAAARANRIAAISVTRRGAQASFPDRANLPPELR